MNLLDLWQSSSASNSFCKFQNTSKLKLTIKKQSVLVLQELGIQTKK